MAAQVLYGQRRERQTPAATRAIVALGLATSASEALERRGPRGVLPVAVAGAVGFGAELIGVSTGRPFGRYAYTDRLGPRFRGVPLLAAAAWALMARPAWVAAGLATPDRRRRIPAAAAALTAWDVFLDPRMVRDGYWEWPGGGRYEGVPLSNFAGWFVTATAVYALWAVLEPEPASADDDRALALYAWTWAGETYANAVLWRRPLTALAGGAAMGTFALPALLARLRR